jgi:hypothetical protein
MDNIINYKCKFRGGKRLNNSLPFSSELFLRWDEVGRIVDIFLPPFISKGGWKGCLWGKRVEKISPFSKGLFFGWHGEMGGLDVFKGQGKAKTFENMLN